MLHTVDKLTLEILFMKMDGYSSKEIASAFGMDEYAVNMRIYRLRKKNKKNIYDLRYIPPLFMGYGANGEKETFAL